MSSDTVPAAGGSAAPVDNQEIIRVFQAMMSNREAMTAKISELTVEQAEYKRVADTLKPMDGARRCYQLINGTLVEKTLAEVTPEVVANRDALAEVLKAMTERLTKLNTEMKEYQAKFNRACFEAVVIRGDEAVPCAVHASPPLPPPLTTLPFLSLTVRVMKPGEAEAMRQQSIRDQAPKASTGVLA